MNESLVYAALVVAAAAACRSTWSPCGLSVLSTITPFGERSRGYRYWKSAAWYIAGAASGGATLGGLAAVVAFAVGPAASHSSVLLSAGAVVALLAALVDSGTFGAVLPLVRRQVNEAWLSRYRPWVYAGGFGWQIGTGLATYLMTAGVVVVPVLGVLTGSPLQAFLVCVAFGVFRGLAVLLAAGCATPTAMRSLHQRLDGLAAPVRWATVGVAGGAGVGLAAAAILGGSGALHVALPALAAVAGGLVGGSSAALAATTGAAACTVPATTAGRRSVRNV